MGFYQRWIVRRLIKLAMRNRILDTYRQRTIGAAGGLALEIGVVPVRICRFMGRPSIVFMRSIPRWNCSIWRGTGLPKRACRCR